MGLTFQKQDDLDKMLDKFAVVPDPKKKARDKDKSKKKNKDKK
ncbi:SPJ_0845 family protein [Lactobacillus acetotolerans]|nr:SPJ_0845 family protein [Lactobacillus acetotolerans]